MNVTTPSTLNGRESSAAGTLYGLIIADIKRLFRLFGACYHT